MINIYFKTIRDRKFKEIEQFRVGCWINVKDATKDDLQKIAELTELDYSDLQDSLDRYELPRFERQDDKSLIFVRNPAEFEEQYTELLTVILSKKYLITISPGKNNVIQYLLEQNTLIATTQQTKLLIKILLRIAQQFTVKTKEVRNNVLHRKEEFRMIDEGDFIFLSESEEILNQYISALIPMNNVIEAITTRKGIPMFEEDEDLLQDLLIAIKQSADICNVNIKSITSLRDSYHLIFTNELNKTIRILTTLTVFLTIPTIIASLFGMNVKIPLQNYDYSFGIVLGIIILIVGVTLIIFYRKKWIK